MLIENKVSMTSLSCLLLYFIICEIISVQPLSKISELNKDDKINKGENHLKKAGPTKFNNRKGWVKVPIPNKHDMKQTKNNENKEILKCIQVPFNGSNLK